MKKVVTSFMCLFGLLSFVQAQVQFELLGDYFGYVSQNRQTYAKYAKEKESLLKLSDSRDPAQIAIEFQGKLNDVVSAHQEIFQGKAAAIRAGVGVAQGLLGSEYAGIIGLFGDLLTDNAADNAKLEAARDKRRLENEFERKFIDLKAELLEENIMMMNMHLAMATYQLSKEEEQKHLDLANYFDCNCKYIESRFSFGSTDWAYSNCPSPATSARFAAVTKTSANEPTVNELLSIIERKLLIPDINFVRAARDFTDIGLAKAAKDRRLLFYRAYLSENEKERMMFVNELLQTDPKNENAQLLKRYSEMVTNLNSGNKLADAADILDAAKNIKIDITGNPLYILCKERFHKPEYISLAVVNGKYIYAYPNGDKAFETEYDFATEFHNGLARVMKRGKWGMIDNMGNPVLQCEYLMIMPSLQHKDFAAVPGDIADNIWTKATFADVAISREEAHIDQWGYVGVRAQSGRFGIYSVKEKRWIFHTVSLFCPIILDEDMFLFVHWERYFRLCDIKGERVNKTNYLDAQVRWGKMKFSEGLSPIPVGWKYDYSEGRGWFSKKYQFINKKGNVAFKGEFDDIIGDGFKNGKCEVVVKGVRFFIDKTGKKIK